VYDEAILRKGGRTNEENDKKELYVHVYVSNAFLPGRNDGRSLGSFVVRLIVSNSL